MKNKTYIFGSIIVLAAAGAFLMLWRARIMGPGARLTAGGLEGISSLGTPIPLPQEMAAKGTLPENTAFQQAEGMQIWLSINPYPPAVSKANEFEITLLSEDGAPVPDGTVKLDLTMPGMYMPPNQLEFTPERNGKYQASGHFTMRGLWRMEAIISADGKTFSVFFEVWL
jgi:hypothetical protein